MKEFPYSLLPGMGREEGGVVAADAAARGQSGRRSHDIAFDPDGNVIIGMGGGTVRADAGIHAVGVRQQHVRDRPARHRVVLDKGLHST